MSSIILSVGQCGNQIGQELVALIDNHSLSHPLSHRDGKLRCVCVDSEPKVIGKTLKNDKKHGKLFREENMIAGQSGRGNNFALGYYGLGGETEEDSLMNRTMDIIRKEVERCDYFAGTIVIHSLTGGTGSGLGSHLTESLRNTYPLAHVMSVAVSPHLSGDSPLQNYNSLLSLAALQRNADCVTVFSNDDVLRHLIAHRGILSRQLSPCSGVSLKDMNQLIATSLAGVLLPLGQKPKKVLRNSSLDSSIKAKSVRRNTSSTMSASTNSSKQHLMGKFESEREIPIDPSLKPSRSRWSTSSTLSSYSFVSEGTSVDEDDSSLVMQRQPRATVSALLRYRNIASKSSGFTSHLDNTNQSQALCSDSSESNDVSTGNEPWEMLRSVCPEPSKKFATIHHIAKSKVTWEALTQSLLHSTSRFDKDGRQFSTLNSLLIARGVGEKPFANSVAKIEKRLKSSLGCVEWNPFPIDFWMSQYGAVGSRDGQSLTLCLNSSKIIGYLNDVMAKARTMYKVGAYVHWFEKHGCTKRAQLDQLTDPTYTGGIVVTWLFIKLHKKKINKSVTPVGSRNGIIRETSFLYYDTFTWTDEKRDATELAAVFLDLARELIAPTYYIFGNAGTHLSVFELMACGRYNGLAIRTVSDHRVQLFPKDGSTGPVSSEVSFSRLRLCPVIP